MGNFDKTYPEANKPDRGQDGQKGYGDDGGARVGSPDAGSTGAGSTGAGSEATRGTDGEAEGHENEHESAYGGKGGEPKKPNK